MRVSHLLSLRTLCPIVAASLAACAGARSAPRSLEVSPPAKLCGDPSLEDDDFCLPDDSVVALLRDGPVDILDVQDTAAGTTSVRRVRLRVRHPERGDLLMLAKWRRAPPDGASLNNDPRRELAAHRFQRLWLGPDEYVVPPVVMRCFDFDRWGEALGESEPTLTGTRCVLGTLSVWLHNVDGGADEVFDPDRFERDPDYRRHLATVNLFTILIDHGDTHWNNFVISKDDDDPRVFVVDNGISFGGFANPFVRWFGQDKDWSDPVVPALPAEMVARLRALDLDTLQSLAVVAHLRATDGMLRAVHPRGPPIDPDDGVRHVRNEFQLGLTTGEIEHLRGRIETLLRRVDSGELKTF